MGNRFVRFFTYVPLFIHLIKTHFESSYKLVTLSYILSSSLDFSLNLSGQGSFVEK